VSTPDFVTCIYNKKIQPENLPISIELRKVLQEWGYIKSKVINIFIE